MRLDKRIKITGKASCPDPTAGRPASCGQEETRLSDQGIGVPRLLCVTRLRTVPGTDRSLVKENLKKQEASKSEKKEVMLNQKDISKSELNKHKILEGLSPPVLENS
ncbi:MAG: hypothetical protein JXA49_06720 [Actinobacteria bacterium]|nr:hypothetical protein [Actinomycetota bacterium]